ncbi:MAG: C1 family peptidase [FCB group bacterium]|jgi:putative hemolysin
MKILFIIYLLLFFFIQNKLQSQVGSPNTSAVYCKKLGYSYEIVKDSNRNEYGICILPNNYIVRAWDFFRGKVAKEYSYCAKCGYDLIIDTIYTKYDKVECPYCVKYDENKKINQKIKMLDLMDKNGDTLIKKCNKQKDISIVKSSNKNSNKLPKLLTFPRSFDLRNVNGHNYVNPIRDQDACSSCYAFAAAACAEGTYNYNTGSYDENRKEFSESFIMWCLGSLDQYPYHYFFGCQGSQPPYLALQALIGSNYYSHEGIILSSSFSYTIVNPGPCSHWNDPKAIFSDWQLIDCNDIDAIKTAILNYGIVEASVEYDDRWGLWNDQSGIYVDDKQDCYDNTPSCRNSGFHVISIIGWDNDQTIGDYWILRNSEGIDWGESGYMKIQVNSAYIACNAAYLISNPVSFNDTHISEQNDEPSIGNVIFRGGADIQLVNGFMVHTGGRFHAYIDNNVPIAIKNGSNSNSLARISNNDKFEDCCNCYNNELFHFNDEQKINSYKYLILENKDELIAYPNPGNGVFFVKNLEKNKIKQIQIFNYLGQIIYQYNNMDKSILDLSNEDPGFYIIKFIGNTVNHFCKIIKY